MVVVFNDDVILVVLIGLLLSIPVGGLYYFDVINGDMSIISCSWAFFSASFISSFLGLKGRIFWIIPTWMVTLGVAVMISEDSFESFKKVSLILGVLFIFLVGLLFLYFYLSNKNKLKSIDEKEIIIPNVSNEYYWEAIENLFYMPVLVGWTPDLCNYNIRVLEKLKRNEIYLEGHDAFQKEFERAISKINREEKINFDTKVRDFYMQQIQIRIEARKIKP